MIPVFPIIALLMASKRTPSEAEMGAQSVPIELVGWVFLYFFTFFGLGSLLGEMQFEIALKWVALLALFCAVPLAFPWMMARRVFVPLGWHRAAYRFGRLSHHFMARDHRGGGALAGALAILRVRGDRTAAIAWIEARLAEDQPLRGAGIAAMGFLQLARGDRESARQMLAEVDALSPYAVPYVAAMLASEWRAAEAASRGDWAEVRRAGTGPNLAETRSNATRFLAAAASRLLPLELDPRGRPRHASKLRLWWRWLTAPKRFRTWAFYQRARDSEPIPSPTPPRVKARVLTLPPRARSEGPDRLRRALTLHARALAEARLSDHDLVRLGRVWEVACADAATVRTSRQRFATLPDPLHPIRDLRSQVEADLGHLLARHRLRLAPTGDDESILATAVWHALQSLHEEVESACEAYCLRAIENRRLPAPAEWNEWRALRELCDQAIARLDPEVAAATFPYWNDAITTAACLLYNQRGEKALANAMFRWLLARATKLGCAGAATLHAENVKCEV
ncbi:MAG: hypothetical protein IT514_14600 [Burkholderiales bacterium]|nr:hypothetical protein [Burkholderiales bacterium]